MRNIKWLNFTFPLYVIIIIGGIYYLLIGNLIYEHESLWNNVASRIVTIIYIVIFHIFFAFTMISFFTTMFTDPGSPPKFWVN